MENITLNVTGTVLVNGTISGTISVTATGIITVQSLLAQAATFDSLADILVGYLSVGTGTVHFTANGSIQEWATTDSAVDLIAVDAFLVAGNNISGGTNRTRDLEVTLANLSAAAGSGSIYLSESNDLNLVNISAPGKIVNITAVNNLVITGTLCTGSTGSITLTSTVAQVITGAGNNNRVTTGTLTVNAVTGINLKTAITSLTATATGTPGSIVIEELDTIGITSVTATNKTVSITAGGTINVTSILTTGTGGSIALTSTGGWIITDLSNTNRITMATLNVQATGTVASGIKITTNVTSLTAKVTVGAGNIAINELNGITLTNVTAFNGWIRIMAAGTVTATNVVSSTDASWNNVTLYTSSGDILIAYVAAGRQKGQVCIVAAGQIKEATTYDTAVDLRAKIAILCAGGAIDESPAATEKDIGTLFTFGNGQQLNINNYTGDLEIFYIGNQRVCVTATGIIWATYIKTAGQDIFFTSTGANILVDYVTTGLVGWGIIMFEAYNSVVMDETSQTGDDPVTVSAQILKIYTTVGDITMLGSYTCGDYMKIQSKYDLNFNGTAQSTNQAVRMKSTSGNEILHGSITSYLDLEITSGSGYYSDAVLNALHGTVKLFIRGENAEFKPYDSLKNNTSMLI